MPTHMFALVFYIAWFVFIVWLVYRFIGLTSDVHYLANKARTENGDEVQKTDWRITLAIVVVALLMLVFALTSGMRP